MPSDYLQFARRTLLNKFEFGKYQAFVHGTRWKNRFDFKNKKYAYANKNW